MKQLAGRRGTALASRVTFISCALSFAGSSSTTEAWADTTPLRGTDVRLVFTAAEDASGEGCGEEALRSEVAANLGRDPFDENAAITARVLVSENQDGSLQGSFEMVDSDANVRHQRVIESSAGDCAALVASLGLALAITLDAEAARVPVPAPEAVTAAPEMAIVPPAQVDLDRALPSPAQPDGESGEPVRFFVGVTALATVAAEPAPSAGAALHVGVRYGAASLALEGRADLPAGEAISREGAPPSQVESSLVVATLVPCGHHRFLFGCGLVAVGGLRGEATGVARPERDTTFYAASGGRIGIEWPIGETWSVRGHADALATLTRTTLRVDKRAIWTTPPVSGALGAGAAATF